MAQLRRDHHRLGAGRLRRRYPRRAARAESRGGGKSLPRRHLPELGLHSDQGAASLRRHLSRHAARQGLWPRREGRVVRHRRGGQALARHRRPHEPGRRLSPEEEQGRPDLGRRQKLRARARSSSRRQTMRRRARSAPANIPPSTSSSRPARGRASCRGWSATSWSGPTSRRWRRT